MVMSAKGDSGTADAGVAKADTANAERPTQRIRRVIVDGPGALHDAAPDVAELTALRHLTVGGDAQVGF